MNKNKELLKEADIPKIASRGAKIYEGLKDKYDLTKNKGKFLAIDIDSKKAYLGESSAKALDKVRRKHPDKIFYIVKIGYDAVETMTRQQ